MLQAAVFTTIFLATMAFPKSVHAIVFLPAIILIPIAKLVAIIVGGFSIPAVALGTLWSKLFKKSLKRTLLVIAVMLIVIAAVLALVFKIENPQRPII